MTELFTQLSGGVSSIGFVVLLILLHKSGVLKMILNNKNGHENGQIKELKDQIAGLEQNHLEHLSQKLDKIIENSTKELLLLEDIRDRLKS